MRLPRLRFTVRRMLVVVAVLGLGIAVPVRLARLATKYRALARGYWMANLKYDDVDVSGGLLTPEQARWKAHRVAMRAYNARLSRKYERLASRPWLPVPADPPPP
jgi:hypothetical protein